MFIIFFLLGVILGSFVNALVWRLHEQLDEDGNQKKLSKDQLKAISISKGRSMCPHCRHELAAKDLIPIVSWLLLGGRCRYCKKPIDKQYPLIELLMGVLFAVSYLAWPHSLLHGWQILEFITWLVMVVGLVALAIYDIRWMLLPNRIVSKLFMIAGISFLFQLAAGRPTAAIRDTLFGVLIGGGIFWVLYQLSQGKWIGGGDVKLGALLGFLLGSPQLAFLYLFLASILGFVWVLPALISKKMTQTSQVPFGPFLIAAAFIVMLWGQRIIDWYTQSLLHIQ